MQRGEFEKKSCPYLGKENNTATTWNLHKYIEKILHSVKKVRQSSERKQILARNISPSPIPGAGCIKLLITFLITIL